MNGNEIIYLNSAFGLLIDREDPDPAPSPNSFERYLSFKPDKTEKSAMFGRIKLPQLSGNNRAGRNGTGNVLIKGNPGSGKTTLALQIAMACANYPNNMLAVYYSLEESPDTILSKVQKLRWNYNKEFDEDYHEPQDYHEEIKVFRKLDSFSCNKDDPTDKELADSLLEFLKGQTSGILLPSLSPRGQEEGNPSEHRLFQERYKQLEIILRAGRKLRELKNESNGKSEYKDAPVLALICIDSLSVFGEKPLTRQETHMLFELFKYYKIIGVFIGENVTSEAEQVNACDYISDVVIRLQEGEEYGHLFHYICVEKSRYQPQVFGRHPYRIRTPSRLAEKDSDRTSKKCFDDAFVVYPSVHYLISKQRGQVGTERSADPKYFEKQFAIERIDDLLPLSVLKNNYVIAVLGPQSTFKTDIAKNFLVSGLLHGENVLYINLNETLSFSWSFRHSTKMLGLLKDLGEKANFQDGIYDTTKLTESERSKLGFLERNIVKLDVAIWPFSLQGEKDNRATLDSKLLEIVFKNGALLPEELLDYTLRYIKQHNIKRVVLDDINQIGVCYPCLRQNKITGEMFLPAFVRLLSNFEGMKLVILGTTEQAKASDVILEQARTLSDATLTTKMKRDYTVEIFGEGLIARNNNNAKKIIHIDHTIGSDPVHPFEITDK